MGLIDDRLNEDEVIPNQRFYGVSFLRDVSADETDADKLLGIDKSNVKPKNIIGMKIKFFSKTYEEATELANKMRDIDPRFDIYIGEVGKWCPFNPHGNNCVENYEYAEKELNEIMKAYEQNQEKVKIYEEKRKIQGKINNGEENIKRKEKNKRKLLKEMKSSGANHEDLIKKLDEDIKKLEKEQKELKNCDGKYEKLLKEISSKQTLNYEAPKKMNVNSESA